MLSHEDNELLCRVGAGTPMGALVRRYWTPIALSSDLDGPDSGPRLVKLFGDSFVVFRDSDGQPGVLNEQCMHRGASLALGRVEGCGIRCLYHGWKYGVDGTILETPNQPDSRFKQKLRAPAYPVREAADLIWVYLGPPDKQPEFPSYAWMNVPSQNRVIAWINMRSNWVQNLEGLVDSSHVGILHQSEMAQAKTGAFENTTQGKDHFPTEDDAPTIQLQDTDFGFQYAAIRHSDDGNPDNRYVRVTPYVMPYMTYVPPGSPAAMFVPIDDESCAMIQVIWDVEQAPDRGETFRLLGLDNPVIWNPDDRWLNLLPQDRQAMTEGRSWTGLYGLVSQDAAMTLSMGGIFDRSHEHVVPADMAVVRLRRLLIKAAKTLATGEEPVGLDRSISTDKISGAAGIVTAGSSWGDLVPGNVAL